MAVFGVFFYLVKMVQNLSLPLYTGKEKHKIKYKIVQ